VASFHTNFMKRSLALVDASTQVSFLVLALSAPATNRFSFWPG